MASDRVTPPLLRNMRAWGLHTPAGAGEAEQLAMATDLRDQVAGWSPYQAVRVSDDGRLETLQTPLHAGLRPEEADDLRVSEVHQLLVDAYHVKTPSPKRYDLLIRYGISPDRSGSGEFFPPSARRMEGQAFAANLASDPELQSRFREETGLHLQDQTLQEVLEWVQSKKLPVLQWAKVLSRSPETYPARFRVAAKVAPAAFRAFERAFVRCATEDPPALVSEGVDSAPPHLIDAVSAGVHGLVRAFAERIAQTWAFCREGDIVLNDLFLRGLPDFFQSGRGHGLSDEQLVEMLVDLGKTQTMPRKGDLRLSGRFTEKAGEKGWNPELIASTWKQICILEPNHTDVLLEGLGHLVGGWNEVQVKIAYHISPDSPQTQASSLLEILHNLRETAANRPEPWHTNTASAAPVLLFQVPEAVPVANVYGVSIPNPFATEEALAKAVATTSQDPSGQASEIRVASLGDVPRLHRELFSKFGGKDMENLRILSVSEIENLVRSGRLWVVEQDGKFVGCAYRPIVNTQIGLS